MERRYDLDWLRVIAILLLHFFHSAMPFAAEWDWHIRNNQESSLLMECSYFLSRWRMPLLFFISGIGTTYVLSRATAAQYAFQRTKRLLIPLIFGIVIIVPPQVYYERLFDGDFSGSFFSFYPSVFTTGPYPEGNFSWHHLWFIAYLFVFSLVAIPLFLFLKSASGKALINKTALFSSKIGLWWVVVPTFLASLLYFDFPEETHALIDDWATFAKYLSFFITGYFIGVHEGFWNIIIANRRHYLKVAFFATIVTNYIRWNDLEPEWGVNYLTIMYMVLWAVNTWAWLFALMGYARKYMNSNSKTLQYANEGIYPFFILHQTLIVIIGYYVLGTDDGLMTKYLFLAFTSFFVSLGLYEFLIRPYNICRFLFGMKPKTK